MSKTTVTIASKTNFDPQTDAILNDAVRLLEQTMNSPQFASEMAATFFRETGGLSSQQVLDKLLAGSNKNGTIILNLDLYNNPEGGNEVGHTDANNIIHTYRNYVLQYGAPCYAAHLAHEYCHTLGFTHNFPFGRRKHQTVPYLVGDIVGGLTGCDGE